MAGRTVAELEALLAERARELAHCRASLAEAAVGPGSAFTFALPVEARWPAS